MCQNGFSKMTKLLVNVVELSVNLAEFCFFRRLLFFSQVKHDSADFLRILSIFSKFSENQRNLRRPNFFAPQIFKHCPRNAEGSAKRQNPLASSFPNRGFKSFPIPSEKEEAASCSRIQSLPESCRRRCYQGTCPVLLPLFLSG
jgi:hypothetical protein